MPDDQYGLGVGAILGEALQDLAIMGIAQHPRRFGDRQPHQPVDLLTWGEISTDTRAAQ